MAALVKWFRGVIRNRISLIATPPTSLPSTAPILASSMTTGPWIPPRSPCSLTCPCMGAWAGSLPGLCRFPVRSCVTPPPYPASVLDQTVSKAKTTPMPITLNTDRLTPWESPDHLEDGFPGAGVCLTLPHKPEPPPPFLLHVSPFLPAPPPLFCRGAHGPPQKTPIQRLRHLSRPLSLECLPAFGCFGPKNKHSKHLRLNYNPSHTSYSFFLLTVVFKYLSERREMFCVALEGNVKICAWRL